MAFYLMCISLAGLLIGPTAVGILNDNVFGVDGVEILNGIGASNNRYACHDNDSFHEKTLLKRTGGDKTIMKYFLVCYSGLLFFRPYLLLREKTAQNMKEMR